MRQALAAAEARLVQAQADVTVGKGALKQQQDAVIDTITSIYEQGDPDLLAFASLLNAQTPADVTRQQEANRSLIDRQNNAYDDLRAAEVLLEVHQDQVEKATIEVAAKRQEAADHLVEIQALTRQATAAKDHVLRLVGARKESAMAAEAVREKDREVLMRLRKREARIHQLIQEAIRKARERAHRRAARSGTSAGEQSGDTGGLLLRPVDAPVTSPFGYRLHPIYHYWGLHDGDDFGAACGTPLRAVSGGTVLSEYYSSVWGNRLYLNVGMVNGKFITVIYNHLSGYAVQAGASVARGQTVGYVGTTGWSTGCHLHFTVMADGRAVDPMPYF
jgi:murein DD-endopeptidase MepM/ murein hydrolase activator NlpD